MLKRLFQPVDIAFLVFFRVAFGTLMLWEVVEYFATGKIYYNYLKPITHFSYYGFEWVKAWPGNGLYVHFFVMGVCALFIAVGFWYRVSTALFFLGFTYVFLLDKTHYLNHFYLISLISFLMIFLPANRAFSVDAWLRPSIKSEAVPCWILWLLRFQIALPYIYGGIVKLNEDWLRGWPLKIWLPEKAGTPLIGWLFKEEWFALFMSYSGLLLDLSLVPLLLWKRTRLAAFTVSLAFHLSNAWLWEIGVFPWFMIPATLLFFDPSWPRDLLRLPCPPDTDRNVSGPPRAVVLSLLGLYAAFQILFPLRNFLYPGNVNWTEQGFYFTWRMKLNHKSGSGKFMARDTESGKVWTVNPYDLLTNWQVKRMTSDPDMVLQFCRYAAKRMREQAGLKKVEVMAILQTSFNGRKAQYLIDPNIDLASAPRTLLPYPWIVPMTQPVRELFGSDTK